MTLWRHHDVMTSSLRYDVIIMLWPHHDVMTSSWLYDVIMRLWRHHGVMTSSLLYDVIMTLWRHHDILTSSWRYDVIMLWRHGPKYSYMLDFDFYLPLLSLTQLYSSSAELKICPYQQPHTWITSLAVWPTWISHSLLHSQISFLNTYL